MICKNCGKENAETSRFCIACGTPLEAEPAVEETVAAPVAEETAAAPAAEEAPAAPEAKKPAFDPKAALAAVGQWAKAKKKLLIPAAAGVAVLAIALIVLFVILGRQVNMGDYLHVEVSGFNGYSELECDFDGISFALRVDGDKEYDGYQERDGSRKDEKEAAKVEKSRKLSALLETVEIEVKCPEGKTEETLSNGDVIEISLSCDEDELENFDVSVKPVTVKYEVEGLKDAKVYDLLSNFTVEFSGYDGNGEARVVCTKSEEKKLGKVVITTQEGSNEIRIEKRSGNSANTGYWYVEIMDGNYYDLANGDKLTLTAHIDSTTFADKGVILENVSKEIAVSGLKEVGVYDVLANFDVELTGCNGYASAQWVCTKSETVQVGDLRFTTNEGDRYISIEHVEYGYWGSLYVYVDYDGQYLSNGDVVHLTADGDEDWYISNGVKLTGFEKDITVSGLEEPKELDLLGFYQVLFTGVNGDGDADITYDQEIVTLGDLSINLRTGYIYQGDNYVDYFHVSLSDSYYLSNGDTVTLNLYYMDETSLLPYGYRITATSVEISVTTLSEYASSPAEIRNAANLAEVEETVKNEIRERLNDYYDWSVLVEDATSQHYNSNNMVVGEDFVLDKVVILIPNDGVDYGIENYVWMVYTVTLSDQNMPAATHYVGVSLHNVYVDAEGNIQYSTLGSYMKTSKDYETFQEKNSSKDSYTFIEE